jgi:hypothetical protein
MIMRNSFNALLSEPNLINTRVQSIEELVKWTIEWMDSQQLDPIDDYFHRFGPLLILKTIPITAVHSHSDFSYIPHLQTRLLDQ